MAEASALTHTAAAPTGAIDPVAALGDTELRRWHTLCRAGEGAGDPPWPEEPSRDLVRAVLSSVVDGDRAMLEPAARAWAQHTSPMPVLVGRLGYLREIFVEVGLLSGPDAARRLAAVLDKVTAVATEAAMAELEDAALTDALTGSGNRRAMESAGRVALASAARTGSALSVVMMDLDGLKDVNDTHGHAAGDRALAALADGVRAALRDTDQLFRIGGDEFVALLPLAPASAVAELMSRARRAGAPPFSWGAASAPVDGTDLETLVHIADSRLYTSRRTAGYYGAAGIAGVVSPRRTRRRRWALVAAALLPVAAVVALAFALTASGHHATHPGTPGRGTSPGVGRAGTGVGTQSGPGRAGSTGQPGSTSGGPASGSGPGATTGGPGTAPPGSTGGSTATTTPSPDTTTTNPGLLPGVTLPLVGGLPIVTVPQVTLPSTTLPPVTLPPTTLPHL